MRIISWNLRRNPDAVEYAFDVLGADVLMAQESSLHNFGGLDLMGQFIDERWVKHRWGNGIYSKTKLTPIPCVTEYRGSLGSAAIDSPLGSLCLLNVYGLFEKVSPETRKKSAIAGLHRKLSDLAPLLRRQVQINVHEFLLVGDLNIDRRMDSHPNFRRKGVEPAEGVFKRIEDFQMTDLLRRDYPECVQTYRSVRGNFPWQLDHAFVSSPAAQRVTAQVLTTKEIDAMSDHRPIVLEIS